MRTLTVFLVLSLTSLVPGCARFEPQPISPARNIEAFAGRSLTDSGLKSYLERNLHHELSFWPLSKWDFTNLTLAAFYYNPDLDVARAKWATQQAARKTAGERPNPTVSVQPAFDTTTSYPSPWLVTSTLDLPIETAGKRGYRLALAEHLSEAARLNIASAAWQVRSKLKAALVDLNIALRTEALLKEQQQLQATNITILKHQLEAGAISTFEMTQAKVAADNTRLAWWDAQRQSAEARARVAEAIGLPSSALSNVEIAFTDLDKLPALPENDARHQALLNRPDILSGLAEYAASESALQLEIAKQYPDVHLNPGYEFDQGDNKWSVGFTITLPVLNQNQGAIAEALAKRNESAATFQSLQARVLAEIERSLSSYELAKAKKTDADALQSNLGEQEKGARAMLEAGEISTAELISLELQLSASGLARVDALGKAQLALGALEDALQSPCDLPVSAWQICPRISATNSVKQHP